jgi:phage terminase Nu1 subunit (DNA packaging protein)
LPKRLTRTALAAQLGISKQAFAKYVARGCPVTSVQAAAAWRAQNVRERSTGSRVTEPAGLNAERMRLLKAQADAAEADNRVRAGELVTAAGVRAAAAAAARAIVSRLTQMPDRLAPQLLGLTDARQAAAIVRAECDAIRAAVAAEIAPDAAARAPH